MNYVPVHLTSIDTGVPIKVLAGLHAGCMELIANDSVKDITDLRGKRVGTFTLDSLSYTMVALMAAYVGLDPAKDIEWVIWKGKAAEGFVAGKVRRIPVHATRTAAAARQKIGHTIVNTTVDRPGRSISAAWSRLLRTT